MTTTDEVQQTLAEYEKLAIGSGSSVRIDPPEFSSQATTWAPIWAGDEPPQFARATVYRDEVPTTVYVSWAESLPAVDEWRDLWMRKPMKLFGAYTLRTALRRAYRDVIGDRFEPDEIDPPDEAAADRDWSAELAVAQSVADVDALWADAKRARAVTVELERAFRARNIAMRGLGIGAVLATPEVAVPPRPESAVMASPRPKPMPPKTRLEDTVRRPKQGERRPQRQKPRGPRV